MRAVIQRVSQASVTIDGVETAKIGFGLVILLGVTDSDTQEDVEWLTGKIAHMRIFADDAHLLNRSIIDAKGQVLVVSQFTLYASTRKGNRPSFVAAARPEIAITLYESFVEKLTLKTGRPTCTGRFGANMQVALVNDGPVTIIIDTKHRA